MARRIYEPATLAAVKRTVTATKLPTGLLTEVDVGRLIAAAKGNCQGPGENPRGTRSLNEVCFGTRTPSERYIEFGTQSIHKMTEGRQFAKTVTRPQSTEPRRKKAGGEGFGRSHPSVESRGSVHQTPNSAVWLDLQGAGERVANVTGGGSVIRTGVTVSTRRSCQPLTRM
jgi:hypothetical protein